MATGKSKNAKVLSAAWGINAKHSLYRASGDWYHTPREFPFALLDENGYVLFDSEPDLRIPEISVSSREGKDWLSVRKPGICGLAGYVRKRGGHRESVTEGEAGRTDTVALREYDDAERCSVSRSSELTYRRLHNRMTNALRRAFAPLSPAQGKKRYIEFDVLLPNYDGAGRDLLIEAKPDPDRGSIRIAIGQLFDYRRSLKRAASTDLAILTIGPPERSYLELLLDLGITALWFEEEKCESMRGNGKAWAAVSAREHLMPTPRTTGVSSL